MSLRLEMLQVARLAPKVLGDASELVQNFLTNQQNSDGGFKDREGKSDPADKHALTGIGNIE